MTTENPLRSLANMNHPGNWFISALESVQRSKKPARTDKGWFHPSALVHTCDAFLAFQFLGVPSEEEIPARLRRIFDHGSGRDGYLKQDTKRSGVSLIKKESDRKIEIPDLRIRGELDEYVKNPFTGDTMVVDFKTMNDEEWKALKEQKPSHTIQLQPYIYAKSADMGGVLYENKNNQDWKFFTAKFNYGLWNNDIVGRIRRILTQLKHGQTPQRTPLPNDSQCPFYRICAVANFPKLVEEAALPLDI